MIKRSIRDRQIFKVWRMIVRHNRNCIRSGDWDRCFMWNNLPGEPDGKLLYRRDI